MSLQTRPGGIRKDITAADADVEKIDSEWPRAVFVGTAGTVKIMDPPGNISTWKVPAGAYILATVRQVMSTGTDASDFVACY